MARHNVEYKVTQHTVRGHTVDTMEVFIKDKLVATIYPSDHYGLRIMTRYLTGPPTVLDLGEVAAVNIEFREPPP
jgi:hypothetical protein